MSHSNSQSYHSGFLEKSLKWSMCIYINYKDINAIKFLFYDLLR